MPHFYQSDLGSEPDSPFARDASNKLVRRGYWLDMASHVQVYGWVEVGGNVSTNSVKPGGNVPVGYDYTPDTVQLDQAVVYIERLPDTVQNDHFDWGFRLSAIYGVDYRYTTAYGLFSLVEKLIVPTTTPSCTIQFLVTASVLRMPVLVKLS